MPEAWLQDLFDSSVQPGCSRKGRAATRRTRCRRPYEHRYRFLSGGSACLVRRARRRRRLVDRLSGNRSAIGKRIWRIQDDGIAGLEPRDYFEAVAEVTTDSNGSEAGFAL